MHQVGSIIPSTISYARSSTLSDVASSGILSSHPHLDESPEVWVCLHRYSARYKRKRLSLRNYTGKTDNNVQRSVSVISVKLGPKDLYYSEKILQMASRQSEKGVLSRKRVEESGMGTE